jgi:hypothetical protein
VATAAGESLNHGLGVVLASLTCAYMPVGRGSAGCRCPHCCAVHRLLYTVYSYCAGPALLSPCFDGGCAERPGSGYKQQWRAVSTRRGGGTWGHLLGGCDSTLLFLALCHPPLGFLYHVGAAVRKQHAVQQLRHCRWPGAKCTVAILATRCTACMHSVDCVRNVTVSVGVFSAWGWLPVPHSDTGDRHCLNAVWSCRL